MMDATDAQETVVAAAVTSAVAALVVVALVVVAQQLVYWTDVVDATDVTRAQEPPPSVSAALSVLCSSLLAVAPHDRRQCPARASAPSTCPNSRRELISM